MSQAGKITLCFTVAACLSASCPNGWVPGPTNNCYKFVMTPKASWTKAQGLSSDMGGGWQPLTVGMSFCG